MNVTNLKFAVGKCGNGSSFRDRTIKCKNDFARFVSKNGCSFKEVAPSVRLYVMLGGVCCVVHKD